MNGAVKVQEDYSQTSSQKEMSNSEYEANMVNGDDIAYILGEHQYTWDEFYDTLEKERASGSVNCPQASYIALELLTSQLMQLAWRSPRTNSETYKDLIQNAYLTITENIGNFDRSQSAFKTYIMKWFQALARETRSDGLSDYQSRTLGYRVVSTDAFVSKNTLDGDAEVPVEFMDEQSSIEDIVERKERARSSALLHQMLGNENESEDEEAKKNAYINAACYHLFLGGVSNLPDDVKEELENIITERV